MRVSFVGKILLTIFVLNYSNALFAQNKRSSAMQLYNNARKKSMGQNWHGSLREYEHLVRQYPRSRYTDDAQFWIGYCLEQIPERQKEAFDAYQKLIDDFPRSAWADDALVHQISIAEQLILSGESSYRNFLQRQLANKVDEVRFQAALALGRLKDDRAVPVLQKMLTSDTYGETALELIKTLTPEEFSAENQPTSAVADEQMASPAVTNNSLDAKNITGADKVLSFEATRYEQYRSMLKSSDRWNHRELLEFGLWYILPTDQFSNYFHLTNTVKRENWLQKFWKQLDPTPTTVRNEAREEFERRVSYAKENFHKFWNNNETRYLKDQYLRQGSPHAPWDARGELYIKYGEPDFRSVVGWQTEHWVYNQLDLDLMVKQFMTNIYGNAIRGTTVSGRYQRNYFDAERVDAEHIYKPEFIYNHDYHAKLLKNVDVQEAKNPGKYLFQYSVPVKEVRINTDGGRVAVRFKRSYVVFDDDMQVVREQRDVLTGENISVSGGRAAETIAVALPRGAYRIAVRLETVDGKKMAIFKAKFTIE